MQSLISKVLIAISILPLKNDYFFTFTKCKASQIIKSGFYIRSTQGYSFCTDLLAIGNRFYFYFYFIFQFSLVAPKVGISHNRIQPNLATRQIESRKSKNQITCSQSMKTYQLNMVISKEESLETTPNPLITFFLGVWNFC